MKVELRIKPGKIQPSALGPMLASTGVPSKQVAVDLDKLTRGIPYLRYFVLLDVDLKTRKYTITPLTQPDSIELRRLANTDTLTAASLYKYAEATLSRSYAKTIDKRIIELKAILRSCKLTIK